MSSMVVAIVGLAITVILAALGAAVSYGKNTAALTELRGIVAKMDEKLDRYDRRTTRLERKQAVLATIVGRDEEDESGEHEDSNEGKRG